MAGEWRERQLRELTENFDSARIPVSEADRRPGPYPYYGASGIVDFVDRYLFDGEYLLIAEDGENLRTRKTPVAFLAQGRFWVNNHAHIVQGNAEADTRFLMYALAQANISGYLTGSTMPKLTQGAMNRISIMAPPINEQRAIAHILGTLDDKIELNRRMNETLEEMARALFKSWFVDFEPVLARAEGSDTRVPSELAELFPSELEDSRIGVIPKGWSIATLGQVTTKIGSGATPRGGSAVYTDNGIALIRSQNVYDSQFVWDGLARITDAAAAALQGVTVEPEDILLNITGASILRTCVVDPEVLPARVNQHVCIIRPMPQLPARYIHFHLLQPSTKAFLMGMDAGASRQAVTKAHIESVPIVIPSAAVLDKFAEVIREPFAAINNNNSQSQTLTALRDTLLPKLISGELRVKTAEKIVEAVA